MTKEKILLAVLDFKKRGDWSVKDSQEEMEELVAACRGEVIDHVICRADRPTAALLITEGKAKEIAEVCLAHRIDTVIFSHDLKGSQQRNLEEIIKRKTIDRTQLILDIFAKRAVSQEGKMQVELAQLEYLLPRLVGKGIELSRLGGGIGTLGPGETKLEVDRRRLGQRITKLKRELKNVSLSRKTKRKRRQDRGIPMISLVGYTNAGKSTLLNTLTKAHQSTRDGLFTTLDSLSRQYTLPNNQQVIISDTVGFMHDLPHRLIEAFKATLEEVQEADLLLHVLDISHLNFRNFHEAVMKVLAEIDCRDKPIITVLNKIDCVHDEVWLQGVVKSFENAECISALHGKNILGLMNRISAFLKPTTVDIDAKIPINRMDLVNAIHKQGQVHSIEYLPDTVHIVATVPIQLSRKLEDNAFLKK